MPFTARLHEDLVIGVWDGVEDLEKEPEAISKAQTHFKSNRGNAPVNDEILEAELLVAEWTMPLGVQRVALDPPRGVKALLVGALCRADRSSDAHV
jgi:tRNA/tmRNA/rRNA uracil-C5-methylase (TrmA/RlmC/RlmD family)